jgi:hypothetical protein
MLEQSFMPNRYTSSRNSTVELLYAKLVEQSCENWNGAVPNRPIV